MATEIRYPTPSPPMPAMSSPTSAPRSPRPPTTPRRPSPPAPNAPWTPSSRCIPKMRSRPALACVSWRQTRTPSTRSRRRHRCRARHHARSRAGDRGGLRHRGWTRPCWSRLCARPACAAACAEPTPTGAPWRRLGRGTGAASPGRPRRIGAEVAADCTQIGGDVGQQARGDDAIVARSSGKANNRPPTLGEGPRPTAARPVSTASYDGEASGGFRCR